MSRQTPPFPHDSPFEPALHNGMWAEANIPLSSRRCRRLEVPSLIFPKAAAASPPPEDCTPRVLCRYCGEPQNALAADHATIRPLLPLDSDMSLGVASCRLQRASRSTTGGTSAGVPALITASCSLSPAITAKVWPLNGLDAYPIMASPTIDSALPLAT